MLDAREQERAYRKQQKIAVQRKGGPITKLGSVKGFLQKGAVHWRRFSAKED